MKTTRTYLTSHLISPSRNLKVNRGINMKTGLLISLMVLFLFAIFWAFFHSALLPTIELGTKWPTIELLTQLPPIDIDSINLGDYSFINLYNSEDIEVIFDTYIKLKEVTKGLYTNIIIYHDIIYPYFFAKRNMISFVGYLSITFLMLVKLVISIVEEEEKRKKIITFSLLLLLIFLITPILIIILEFKFIYIDELSIDFLKKLDEFTFIIPHMQTLTGEVNIGNHEEIIPIITVLHTKGEGQAGGSNLSLNTSNFNKYAYTPIDDLIRAVKEQPELGLFMNNKLENSGLIWPKIHEGNIKLDKNILKPIFDPLSPNYDSNLANSFKYNLLKYILIEDLQFTGSHRAWNVCHYHSTILDMHSDNQSLSNDFLKNTRAAHQFIWHTCPKDVNQMTGKEAQENFEKLAKIYALKHQSLVCAPNNSKILDELFSDASVIKKQIYRDLYSEGAKSPDNSFLQERNFKEFKKGFDQKKIDEE